MSEILLLPLLVDPRSKVDGKKDKIIKNQAVEAANLGSGVHCRSLKQ